MLEHFVFSSRIYFSSSLRWITIPYFRERFWFLCLSIYLSFPDIVIVLAFIMPFPARFFKQKWETMQQHGVFHFCGLGGQGDMLPASKNIQIPVRGRWMFDRLRIYAGSACYLWQTSRREFACCTSIGECLTTHKGVAARFFGKPVRHSGCGRSPGQIKNCHNRGRAGLPCSGS